MPGCTGSIGCFVKANELLSTDCHLYGSDVCILSSALLQDVSYDLAPLPNLNINPKWHNATQDEMRNPAAVGHTS